MRHLKSVIDIHTCTYTKTNSHQNSNFFFSRIIKWIQTLLLLVNILYEFGRFVTCRMDIEMKTENQQKKGDWNKVCNSNRFSWACNYNDMFLWWLNEQKEGKKHTQYIDFSVDVMTVSFKTDMYSTNDAIKYGRI